MASDESSLSENKTLEKHRIWNLVTKNKNILIQETSLASYHHLKLLLLDGDECSINNSIDELYDQIATQEIDTSRDFSIPDDELEINDKDVFDEILSELGFNEPDIKDVTSVPSEKSSVKDNSFMSARRKLEICDPQKAQQIQDDQKYPPKSELSTAQTYRAKMGLNSKPLIKSKNQWNSGGTGFKVPFKKDENEEIEQKDEYKGVDPKLVELIMNEIIERNQPVSWDDIAGLNFVKNTIKEVVVWPMLRPDIFTGLRGPPKGILLFGPPGTGKTLIGKCIASQSHATFFSISASSLTSKWVGEGEKLVKALFMVARHHKPSVIFIDEIDSLLTQRCDGEHESSRRIKTEFLVQLDGCGCNSEDQILLIGATNRPQELDEAARRRLVKRLYVPLPGKLARRQIVANLLNGQKHEIDDTWLDAISEKTIGYSAADVTYLCKEAALGPIRSITDISSINADQVRAISGEDFMIALQHVKSSVAENEIQNYISWNKLYGSFSIEEKVD